MQDKRRLFLALAEMTFLKKNEKVILQQLQSVEDLSCLTIADISQMIQRSLTTTLWQPQNIVQRTDEIEHCLQMFQINAVHFNDDEYPALLKEIYDPPYMLFYRGNIGVLHSECVSVVGTRHPTRGAADAAFTFAAKAANEGFTVISGLAYGIDSFAHRGAISAMQRASDNLEKTKDTNALTCAVLASGVDTIYPVGNKQLARAILSGNGCVISEYTPQTPITKWQFPERNRIISGLSPATIVVDAPEKSGALITADFALEQGRDVFFHEAALQRYENSEKNIGRDVMSYVSQGAPVVSSFTDYLEQKDDAPARQQRTLCPETQLTLFEG
jgi:DNA processing protein